MATIASMIYSIEAQTASIEKSMVDVKTVIDHAEQSMLSSITTGAALGEALEHMGERGLEALSGLIEGTTLYVAELAIQGSHVADVEENFNRLTESAGHLGDELLGRLKSGTHGTIDDFVLMKDVNRDLAAGMNLTDQQFGTLSDGAFALAKVTGGDVASALETMNDAMLTGRVRALALLTGKIDLKAGEAAFAESLGGTAKELTAEGKLEADRETILAAVEASLARVGEQQDSLADKVQQARTWWVNFNDTLGKTIAQSPVLAAGLDGARLALVNAFGGNQQALIDNIAKAVNSAAIYILDFGLGAGAVAGAFVQVWSGVETVVLAVETAAVGVAYGLGVVMVSAEKAGIALHLFAKGDADSMIENVAALKTMTVGLAEETAAAARGAAGQSELGKSITTGTGVLYVMRDSLIAAQTAQDAQTASTTAFVGPLQQAGAGVQQHGAYLKDVTDKTKAFDAAWAELNSMGDSFLETMATINPKILEQIQYYVTAGATVHTLAAAYPELSTAQVEAVFKYDAASKATTLELTKLWAEYDSLIVSGSETAYDKAGAAIDKWYAETVAKQVAAKRDTAEFYAAVSALDDQKWAHLNYNTLAGDANSHEHLIKAAADLQAQYDFDMAHSDSFTNAYLVNLKKTVDAAKITADTWTTALGGSLDGLAAKSDSTTATIVGNFKQIAAASQAASLGAVDGGQMDKFTHMTASETAAVAAGQFIDLSQVAARWNAMSPAARAAVESRDYGGAVQAGQSYLIGTGAQPELFTPSTSGTMTPNGGGGGTTIHLYVTQPLGTPAAIAKAVDEALMARQRNTGQRL